MIAPPAFRYTADDKPPAPAVCPLPPGAASCAHSNLERDPRCGHPPPGPAGSRTSLLPLIVRCGPVRAPTRAARHPRWKGGCRCHLRYSRPPPAGLACQGASRLPADRTWQRPTATCSVTPAAGARPSAHATHAWPAARTTTRCSASAGSWGREKITRPIKRRDSPQSTACGYYTTPGRAWARGQAAVSRDGDANRGRRQVGHADPKRGKRPHRKQAKRSAPKRRQKMPKPVQGTKRRKSLKRHVTSSTQSPAPIRPTWRSRRADTCNSISPVWHLPLPPCSARSS